MDPSVTTATALSLMPSIISGGFGVIMLVLQWSLKRNLDHLDKRAEGQDGRSEKIEKSIDGLRSEIGAMSHNMQTTANRFDTRTALMERDLGSLQGTVSKLENRVDRLAEHWRTEHEKLDERVAARLERAMTDVLDTIDELKRK